MLSTTLLIFREDSDAFLGTTHSAMDVVSLHGVTTPIYTYAADASAPAEADVFISSVFHRHVSVLLSGVRI